MRPRTSRNPGYFMLIACALALSLEQPLKADYANLFTIGTAGDGNNDPFAWVNWETNAAPGSPTAIDDDFYAGVEPITNFENAVTDHDRFSRIHFTLTAGQINNSKARFRISFATGWGWWNGEGYGTSTLRVKMNGQVMGTKVINHYDSVTFTANSNAVLPVVGDNVIEIEMLTPAPAGCFVSFDYVGMEINSTALVDADSDTLPQYWEQENGLSDSDGTDALKDTDGDGLTAKLEFTKGTNPKIADTDGDGLKDGQETTTNALLADTDGDSLSDGAEVNGSPATNPLLVDTDADGASDAWEVRTGYNPTLNTSKPPTTAFALGINFVCEAGPYTQLNAMEVAGFAPQMNWNSSRLLYPWDEFRYIDNEGDENDWDNTGGKNDIAIPQANALVNSAGTALPTATLTFTSDGMWTSGNGGSSNQKLLDGFLRSDSAEPVVVSLTNIPFTNYDVLVYVGANYSGGHGYAQVNNNTGTNKHFYTASVRPEAGFTEPVGSTDTRPWRGNLIRFRGVTGTSCTVKVFQAGNENLGVHAVQIVANNVDYDTDGLPDWWEYTYKLRADLANATVDTDSDGLTNAQEYTRGTNPLVADTDGDGLADGVETGTGTWVNASNTGSNPLLADTDSDSLSDGFEVTHVPSPLNPNRPDSDLDGRSDVEELAEGTDPMVSTSATALMPVVAASPKSLTWDLNNVQIDWDHSRGHIADNEWGDSYLFDASVCTSAEPGWDALRFGMRVANGRLTFLLVTNGSTVLSAPNSPGNDNWFADWDNPTDLRAALGFSGVGPHDISDRLRIRLSATNTSSNNAINKWKWTFEIFNNDVSTTTPVITRSQSNMTASSAVHNASAITWQNNDETPKINRLNLWQHPGVKVYFQSAALEDSPTFANWKDTDEDGMPDVWETTYGFAINNAADAALDFDNDGATNLKEFLAGSHPKNADSDNDGVKDGLEITSGSNPMLASSKPTFAQGLPAGVIGEDFNGNGLSDAWESVFGNFGLAPNVDADGDGFSNLQESVAGTNPFDASSRFWSATSTSGTNLTVNWPQLLHKQHSVLQSPDMTTWTGAAGTPALSNGVFSQTFTGVLGGTPKFYRATVANLDSDNDGVSDWTEKMVLGSNANNANSTYSAQQMDTNGDGTPDTVLSGDYAALIQRFQGGSAGGGFSTSPSGGGSVAQTTSAGSGISTAQAARFLTQATFGPTMKDIDEVRALGYDGWIEAQKTKPKTLQWKYIKTIYDDYFGPQTESRYNGSDDDNFLFGNNLMTAFARGAIQGEDQLRQRIAFALSQILVASRRDANLENNVLGMSDFYDIFGKNALGNYQDVLQQVALHPCMGRYLSHVGNQKANPSINQYPDENFAREVLQLFSIGLWELNMDGSRKVDGDGQHIPTYSNTEITQMARVFTGLWFGGHSWGDGGWSDGDYATPMTMHAERHDFGQKTLLHGFVIPPRAPTDEEAMKDVSDAIQHLFNHANTAPFICKQLIQFLVTDNPSPAYIGRVSAVFANNGAGVRGDLAAVAKAILLDSEAREPNYALMTPGYGRLKEPVIRTMALARAFGMKDVPDFQWWDWGDFYSASRQEPSYSPSVFNFYRPEYRAAGILTQQDLAGPVFQITDSYSSIAFPNTLWDILQDGFEQWETYQFPLDISRESALADNPELLVDRLNTLFCAGQLTASSRTTILNAINTIPAAQKDARARVAAYLILVSPEGAVMR